MECSCRRCWARAGRSGNLLLHLPQIRIGVDLLFSNVGGFPVLGQVSSLRVRVMSKNSSIDSTSVSSGM